AEDGIRDFHVTGVQTCALPIWPSSMLRSLVRRLIKVVLWLVLASAVLVLLLRWVPPPGTALMLERKIESWQSGEPIDLERSWLKIGRASCRERAEMEGDGE